MTRPAAGPKTPRRGVGGKAVAGAAAPSPRVAPAATPLDPAVLVASMRQLFEPLATLAIAHGVPYAALSEALKAVVVEAAAAAHPELPSHRRVSRIATATGINRREVARLADATSTAAPAHRSPATRVYTAWLADPTLTTPTGRPIALPRQGPAPSFEALAQSVTRDLHPRSLLDELCRLGLARIDADDHVHPVGDRVVPRGDADRLLALLAGNAGDHLRAAVANLLAPAPVHLEQAVFADPLSAESRDAFTVFMRAEWQALLQRAVPTMQRLLDADRAAGRTTDQRVRAGLYTYHAPMVAPPPVEPSAPEPRPAPVEPYPATPRPAAARRRLKG